jgi:hypothetical protein
MPAMPDKLGRILRQMRADCMIREAETIRDWPEGQERFEFALSHLREARLQNLLGNVTEREQYRIYSILSFAMPADAPAFDEAPPAHVDAEPPAEMQQTPPEELTCQLGCEACDAGGRMTDSAY